MRVASRYWTLVRIDATGTRKYQEIPAAQKFFTQVFDDLEPVDNVVDGDIQRELLRWYKEASSKDAERCLLCFISWLLEQECVKLKENFGKNHNFSLSDLLPYVLDDNGKVSQPGSSECFSRQILQSFDSKQSSLTTWTIRKFKQHQPLNKFLLECGVYRISDWAILNDTKLPYLTKLLQDFLQNANCGKF
ncbi:hypothetical protein SD80_000710 [Scytonema tolypothrichoides VB-61278]|nr:hypothetical protein SD80_000710 [Scytonema tolypothrichoides VB-61278]